MNEQQRTRQALKKGCRYVSALIEEKALADRSVSSVVLNESFSESEFQKLIQQLVTFAETIPADMTNTRKSLRRAVTAARNTFRSFTRGKASKGQFAKMTSTVAGLLDAIGNVLEVIPRSQAFDDLERMLQSEGVISEAKSLKQILNKEDRLDLDAAIDRVFQPKGLLARLFGSKDSWYGLDADGLRADIESLTLGGLKKLMKTVPDSLTQALSDEDVEEVVSEIDPELASEEGEPSGETKSISRKEIETALTDKFGDRVPMGIVNTVLDVLKDKGLQIEQNIKPEDRLIIEKWRRMAGIPWEADNEK